MTDWRIVLRPWLDHAAGRPGTVSFAEWLAVAETMGVSDAMTPEHFAKLFHDTYERLAPQFGYSTRPASAVAWEHVPEQNRALMIATCTEVLKAFQQPVER